MVRVDPVRLGLDGGLQTRGLEIRVLGGPLAARPGFVLGRAVVHNPFLLGQGDQNPILSRRHAVVNPTAESL